MGACTGSSIGYSEQIGRDEMCRIGQILFERGLAAGAAGNMSCALDNGNFLVTPTGSSMGALDSATLSLVNSEGQLISGKKPTKEVKFHLAVMRNNPEIKAIVHLHSTYATAYACLEGMNNTDALKPMTPYTVMRLGQVQITPYRKPGSELIASDLAAVAAGHKAFLLANHGLVTGGKDLEEAMNNACELEESCKLFFITRGCDVRYLTADEIAELQH